MLDKNRFRTPSFSNQLILDLEVTDNLETEPITYLLYWVGYYKYEIDSYI